MHCQYARAREDTALRRGGWRYSLADLWRNDLARSAPSCEAVDDLESVLLCHGGIVVLLGLEVVNAVTHCGCCGERSEVVEEDGLVCGSECVWSCESSGE